MNNVSMSLVASIEFEETALKERLQKLGQMKEIAISMMPSEAETPPETVRAVGGAPRKGTLTPMERVEQRAMEFFEYGNDKQVPRKAWADELGVSTKTITTVLQKMAKGKAAKLKWNGVRGGSAYQKTLRGNGA
jgi:GTP cyclohydrolase III